MSNKDFKKFKFHICTNVKQINIIYCNVLSQRKLNIGWFYGMSTLVLFYAKANLTIMISDYIRDKKKKSIFTIILNR